MKTTNRYVIIKKNKLVVFFLIIIGLLSCNHNRKNSKEGNIIDMTDFDVVLLDTLKNKVIERINIDLIQGLESYVKYLKDNDLDEYNLIDSCKCFVFEFTQDKKRVNFYSPPYEDLDPIVLIFYRNSKYTPDGYKGIIRIKNYSIAIFDPDNIGEKFYNKDSLENVDINGLQLVKTDDWVSTNIFKIRGDSIAPFIFP